MTRKASSVAGSTRRLLTASCSCRAIDPKGLRTRPHTGSCNQIGRRQRSTGSPGTDANMAHAKPILCGMVYPHNSMELPRKLAYPIAKRSDFTVPHSTIIGGNSAHPTRVSNARVTAHSNSNLKAGSPKHSCTFSSAYFCRHTGSCAAESLLANQRVIVVLP